MITSDGTGRDTYIFLDQLVLKGDRQQPVLWAKELRSGTDVVRSCSHENGYQRWYPMTPRRRSSCGPAVAVARQRGRFYASAKTASWHRGETPRAKSSPRLGKHQAGEAASDRLTSPRRWIPAEPDSAATRPGLSLDPTSKVRHSLHSPRSSGSGSFANGWGLSSERYASATPLKLPNVVGSSH